MTGDDPIKTDPTDGLPAPPVGAWAREKHELLRLYIEITRSTRRKYVDTPRKAGATFIDLYCGAGRAYIKGTDEFVDGSPLVAWKASRFGGHPFSAIYVCDAEPQWLNAAGRRLQAYGAPVHTQAGPSLQAAKRIADVLNPHALHFTLIDPFALDLPFELIHVLSRLKRMDIMVHVSAMELQRNWARYSQAETSPLDTFAPGWRQSVDLRQGDESARLSFIEYWVKQLGGLGFAEKPKFQSIRGPKNIPLYWLVLIAKHEIAGRFWAKAVSLSTPQDSFSF